MGYDIVERDYFIMVKRHNLRAMYEELDDPNREEFDIERVFKCYEWVMKNETK